PLDPLLRRRLDVDQRLGDDAPRADDDRQRAPHRRPVLMGERLEAENGGGVAMGAVATGGVILSGRPGSQVSAALPPPRQTPPRSPAAPSSGSASTRSTTRPRRRRPTSRTSRASTQVSGARPARPITGSSAAAPIRSSSRARRSPTVREATTRRTASASART